MDIFSGEVLHLLTEMFLDSKVSFRTLTWVIASNFKARGLNLTENVYFQKHLEYDPRILFNLTISKAQKVIVKKDLLEFTNENPDVCVPTNSPGMRAD